MTGTADYRRGRAIGDLLIASADRALLRRLARRLRREPGLTRIHVASDQAGVERALTTSAPPVFLLDLPMSGLDGLERLRTIRALSPTTATILLVDSPADGAAIRALRAGVRGYCSRSTDPALLVKAIQLVRQGEIWVGRKVMLKLIEELAALHSKHVRNVHERLGLLTPRERQLSSLIAAGASNKEIADALSITERTVKAHLTNIFQKLGFSSRLHLAILALQVTSPTRTKVQ